MWVLYVDLEHERVRADAEMGPAHRAKLEEAGRRLGEASGEPCETALAEDVTPGRIAERAPSAMVLSGCTTDWAAYDFRAWEGLLEVIRAGAVPTLGICAGHQVIGLAHGVPWGPLGPLETGEEDPDPRFAPGQRKQRGFRPVHLDPACPLFAGEGETATVFQSHYWQLEAVPDGFVRRASSAWSPIQAIERRDRPVFGVQFHPERFDPSHPAGGRVLKNFFAAARQALGVGPADANRAGGPAHGRDERL